MCVLVKLLDVEVGIRGDEVEHVELGMSCPVFPAFVPALNQYLVETVGSGEVNVTLYVLGIGCVRAVGFALAVIRYAEVY